MNASVQWIDGLLFHAVGDTNHGVRMDSAPDGGAASSPMEYVLMALCGCTAMNVVSIIHKMHRTIVQLRESGRPPGGNTPRKFVAANLTYIMISPDVTENEFRRAVELSEQKYCSVSAMVAGGGVALTSTLELSHP